MPHAEVSEVSHVFDDGFRQVYQIEKITNDGPSYIHLNALDIYPEAWPLIRDKINEYMKSIETKLEEG